MPTDMTTGNAAPAGVFEMVWPKVFEMIKHPLAAIMDPLTQEIVAP